MTWWDAVAYGSLPVFVAGAVLLWAQLCRWISDALDDGGATREDM